MAGVLGLAIPENGNGNFRTIFHAHEYADARIVEHRSGHDTMFYNVMRARDGGWPLR